ARQDEFLPALRLHVLQHLHHVRTGAVDGIGQPGAAFQPAGDHRREHVATPLTGCGTSGCSRTSRTPSPTMASRTLPGGQSAGAALVTTTQRVVSLSRAAA